MQGWEHFQERAQWNAIWHNHPTSPEHGQTWQIQWQPNIHTCFLLKKKMEEIERKNARLGALPGESPEHFQERAQWNAILWDFPQVRNYSRGIRHARKPWKQKGSWHNHPTSPEIGQDMTKPVTTKHTHMLLAEKKMEEIERKNARLGALPGESPVECHSVRFPPG